MHQIIITIFIVIIASGICSGLEAALLSVPILKIREIVSTGKKKSSALTLLSIKENINRPLTTIVILNNIANICGSMLVGETAISVFGSNWIGLFSALLTFLIIIFGEIIPKTIGENYSLKVSIFCAKPISILTTILHPLVLLVEKITRVFFNKKIEYITNENEIKTMARIGSREGSIEKGESELIIRTFKLNDVSASDVMTPRVAITYLYVDSPLYKIKDFLINSQHNRIVAVKSNKDEVVGIVYKDELLSALINGNEKKLVSDFIHEANFVMEAHKVNQLLVHFKKLRQHIAIVVDEYGGISGVVTLEDVLEELTGEIVDETDKVVDMQAYARNLNKRRADFSK
ncbi:MAG: hemolysin family protein [Victivallales bacterium]|nr:hemolysin family protein [Victivallales bacterium]